MSSLSGLEPRTQIVEGVRVDYEIFHANNHEKFTNEKRNTIVSVIGKGFACNEEFSYNDAHLAHHLLFAKSKQDSRLAFLITYTFKDEEMNQTMQGTAGAMIFSSNSTITRPNGKKMNEPSLKADNLVKFCVLTEYGGHHLGMISVHTIPDIMNDVTVNGDFVFWGWLCPLLL